MSLWKVVLRSLAQRKLSSALTAASVALGTAVMVAVLAVKAESREGFRQSAFGYDLVVGAKGSPLELVLATVYYTGSVRATVPQERWRELEAHPAVRLAVPVAFGEDRFRGFRVVGTSPAFFTDFEFAPGRRFDLDGRPVQAGTTVFEAVLGATAARATGLRLGDTFSAAHGAEATAEQHGEKWTVVGLLRPTGTAADRAVFIDLDSVYAVAGHDAAPRLTAVIVKTKGGGAPLMLEHDLNRREDLMAVSPAREVARLFEIVGEVDVLLLAVAALVVVVGAVSILVSIYNSMAERRRSIAVMRALGARRAQVLTIVLLESSALCLLGGLGGLVLGHALTAIAGGVLAAQAGVTVSALSFHLEEVAVLAGVLVLGLLAGVLPALKAYRADVADGLGPAS